jgi:hypothetical protein
MLAWRWIKEGRKVSGFAGVEPIRHAVFPGDSYEFQIPFLHMPSEPGQYVLELEMTSAYFGKFSGWRGKSLAIPVTVPSWTAEPTWTTEVLLQYLDSPVVASTDAPKLRVVLDRMNYRPGEHLRIIYQLAVAQEPVLIDAYLALRRSEGDVALATVSGEGVIKPTSHFRPQSSIYFHKRFRISGWLTLPLQEELPGGRYTVYFFFTKAGSYQMLTKATAEFFLEP